MTNLWNLIRDWFVQYIWGGYASNGQFFHNLTLGYVNEYFDGTYDDSEGLFTSEFYISFNNLPDGYIYGLSMADWLSTTSTIIVLVLLLVAFGFLIVGIFRLFSRMFALRS